MTTPDDTEDKMTDELIEASSFGTPEAKALRAQASPEAVEEVMCRIEGDTGVPGAQPTSAINLNVAVEATLTDHGLDVFRRHEKKWGDIVPGRFNPVELPGNVWRGQLWEAFQIFGPDTYMGGKPTFEGLEIRLNSESELVKTEEGRGHQMSLLVTALRDVLRAGGALNEDTSPSGPELLLAAQDFIEHQKEETT